MAETQTTTVSIEDVISLVVPPAAGGYLKLVCDESERYFQPLGGRWGGLPGQRDGVDNFVAAHPSDAYFSPCSWARPVTPSPMMSCSVLWCSKTLGLAGQRQSEPRSRLLDGEAERAIESFTRSPSHGWPPTVIIDEGARVSAVWKLEHAITEGHLRAAVQALAVAYGGDRAQTDPSEALLAIPGSRVTTVYPSVIVRIVAFEPPRAYPINLDKLIS